MLDWIQREFIYLYYYMELQAYQLLPFYVFGTLLGSLISVFAKDRIHRVLTSSHWSRLSTKKAFAKIIWPALWSPLYS